MREHKWYDNGALTQSAFNAANELMVTTPATGFPTSSTYDPNGNLTVQNTGGVLSTNTWSPENRLLNYASGATNESYQYSQDGLRKEKTNSSGTTLFTWDEQNVLLETNTSNAVQARYTNYPGYWGGLASQNQSGVSSYYGFDSQGCTRILVSAAGQVTDSYSNKVFGEELEAGSGTVNPHTYVGIQRYRQQTNGSYLLSVRLLNPFTGSFISLDPIGFYGGTWNPYEYVGNNPVVFSDPSGLFPCQLCIGAELLDPVFGALCAFYCEMHQPKQCSGVLPGSGSSSHCESCSWTCCVAIGEGQWDVIASAQHYNCSWWTPPTQPSIIYPAPTLDANKEWMQSVINNCCHILDIGLDPTKSERSAYYKQEKEVIAENGFGCVHPVKRIKSGPVIQRGYPIQAY
jgi:RHS repeat-associated protein